MTEKKVVMTKISNKEISISYLKKYADKDLSSIETMFSDDIVLRDWKIRVEGKENALKETRKNFENADTIEIEVLSTYENKNTVAAELKITVDTTEELYVVDVITLNKEGKISSIRAYLGRGDN
ncbi:MAG: nuclear transport factor 2 family protein [Maribacter litoralis]|uniref:nuclear transport factor 2 family protein n=1 Tax=Maribacter litoralis TaxID=2059726 RepID=UPI003296927E|eukprot:TRINITY_DN68072_c0_g1_i1.p3 TRINITY_DN68072_c0_g1~~TRINITY_DN68072_c0_g1_i1.p3  ORF type:complete len:124 (+),score=2.27 TRINITY_DN68072_c0_g1_i1:546-917(+)